MINSPRVISSEMLVAIIRQSLEDFTVDGIWWDQIAPNSIHVVDHAVITQSGVKCKILCRHRDSDEAHEHIIKMTLAQFLALPTAEEFARQLERNNDEN